jgi:phage terminase large subunit-like protein
VVRAYDEWSANIVVVESNQGHELLESVLRTIRPMIPIERPNARYSKQARAEPIVALYEQGRVHHLGDMDAFKDLEEEMCSWVPPAPGKRASKSPDRIDALVWALSELNLQGKKIRRNDLGGIAPMNFEQSNPWSM